MSRSLRLLITGATGFIGAHVVVAALARGHQVVAIGRDGEKAAAAAWAGRAPFLACDLHADPAAASAALGPADALMHFAWPGLPHFRDPAHVATHLPADLAFLQAMLAGGLTRLQVAGTCLEYGLAEGAQREDQPADPTLAYPIAKDALRRMLTALKRDHAFALQWARLYYMHGPGQHAKSVLPQLDAAIADGADSFAMSGGEQLRDYLPVETLAERLVRLVERPEAEGIFNICSGRPISIRRLVEERIAARGSAIGLDLGRYPYPDYEPMAFWGDGRRAAAALADAEEDR